MYVPPANPPVAQSRSILIPDSLSRASSPRPSVLLAAAAASRISPRPRSSLRYVLQRDCLSYTNRNRCWRACRLF
jgi:hypothetical protein